MKAHVIENGVVVNTIEISSLDAVPGLTLVEATEGTRGWTWDGTTLVPPARDIPAEQSAKWAEIKALRDLKVQTGGYTTGGKWYHSDTFSRTQQMALVMMGAGIPAVQWKTMDGSFVTMTQTLAGQIFAAAASQDQAMFLQAETLRAQVNAASDPATVDITVGWPATFS